MIPRLVVPACVLLAAGAGLAAAALLRGAFPLDDAYIYLQHAITAAEGFPFRYHPGGPVETGVTSLAWFAAQWLLALALPDAWLPAATLVLGTVVVALTFVVAARLARHLGVSPAIAWLPAGLCLLQPLWFHGAFNGMETGLFGLALLAAARVSYGGSLGWLALLPLVRPEGALAAGLVLLQRWRRTSDRSAFAGRALPVVLVAGLALAWPWLLTGEPAAGWSAKALWLEPHPEVRAFYMDRLAYFGGRSLLFGLSGSAPQPPLDLAADWFGPGALGRWAWVALLGGGVALAWIGRRGRSLTILWVAGTLPCLVSNAWDAQHYRYLVGALPVLATAAVTGWFGRHTVPRTLWVGAALVLAVLGFTLFAEPGPAHRARWLVRGGAESLRTGQLAMGREIDARLPEHARVATHDVGALAWAGRRPVVDLIGLVTPALRGDYRHGPGALYEALAAQPLDRRPTHAAVVPSWRPYLYRTLLFETNVLTGSAARTPRAAAFELWSLAWPDSSAFAPFQNRPVETVVNAGRPWLAIDHVDVAHHTSEAEHGWTQDLTAWRGTRDPLTLVADLGFTDPRAGTGAHALEGGRRLAPDASFTLWARAGRPARLVLRLTAPAPTTVEIGVGGWTDSLQVPASQGRFHEAALPLDPETVNRLLTRQPGEPGGRLGLRVSAEGCVLYHAWLLQPAGQ